MIQKSTLKENQTFTHDIFDTISSHLPAILIDVDHGIYSNGGSEFKRNISIFLWLIKSNPSCDKRLDSPVSLNSYIAAEFDSQLCQLFYEVRVESPRSFPTQFFDVHQLKSHYNRSH